MPPSHPWRQWRQTHRLQEDLLELDQNFAPQPLTEIILEGRIQDAFQDWNDFTDNCLAALPQKPIVWTGPHVFITTAMGVSDLVDSWHDAILHIYVTRSAGDGQEMEDVSVYSLYTTVEERPTRTIDGICKLLSSCQPPLHSVEFSMLLYPMSTLSLSRLTAGTIQNLEVTNVRGEWSGSQCHAIQSANPKCQLEIMVDSLSEDADQVLAELLTENRGPSRLRLGSTFPLESFLSLMGPLSCNTRLKSLTILEAASVHLGALAVALVANEGLEELALVGTFGQDEDDTSFQDLMQAVSTHTNITSLTLNLQLPHTVSEQRVVDLSQAIQHMVMKNKSLTQMSLPLDYAFLEHMSIDVDRYLEYNKHKPRAALLQVSDIHHAVLYKTLVAVRDSPELIYLFLRQAADYI